MTIKEKEKIIDSYCTGGVPESSIKRLFKELNLNEDLFHEFMIGQTCGLIGGEPIYYPWDVKRFIKGLPPLD